MGKTQSVILVGGLGVLGPLWDQVLSNTSSQPDLELKVVDRAEYSKTVTEYPLRKLVHAHHDLADWDREVAHLTEEVLGAYRQHGPVVLVGHSMGGYLAEAVARQHPEAVSQLLLLEASLPHFRDWPIPIFWLPKFRASSTVRELWKRFLHRWAERNGYLHASIRRMRKLYTRPLTWAQVASEFAAFNTWARKLEDLTRTHPLRTPTTALVCLAKQYPPRRSDREWVNQWRKRSAKMRADGVPVKLVLWPQATHLMMADSPTRTWDLLRSVAAQAQRVQHHED